MTGIDGRVSPIPGTRTYAELKSDVASYVLLPSAPEALAVAGNALNDAIRESNNRVWNWALTYTDISLIAETTDYTIPANLKAVRAIERLDANSESNSKFPYIGPKEFLARFPNSSIAGPPAACTIFNYNDTNTLTLSYPPTSSYVAQYPRMRVRYFYRLPVFANDSQKQTIPSEFENFLTWFAKERVAAVFDPAKIGYAAREWSRVYAELIRDDNETHNHDWLEEAIDG